MTDLPCKSMSVGESAFASLGSPNSFLARPAPKKGPATKISVMCFV